VKGIDTNVLVRYLVQDDIEQTKQAIQFIEQEELIFISGVVLCELVWVLEGSYCYAKTDIVNALEIILKTRQFCLEQPKILWDCLRDYRELNIDFSDAYIAHVNAFNECEYTVTFDKKATRLKYFKLLGV